MQIGGLVLSGLLACVFLRVCAVFSTCLDMKNCTKPILLGRAQIMVLRLFAKKMSAVGLILLSLWSGTRESVQWV